MAKPGDFYIRQATLSSSRGIFDFSAMLITGSVFESVFTPGIMADFTILDLDDALGGLIIAGDEVVNFSWQAPGGLLVNLILGVLSVEDISQADDSMSSKKWVIHTVSQESLQAKTNYIQKSYNNTIDQMVSDIKTNFLKSQKPLTLESTQGLQNIIIPNYSPYQAIDMLKQRAISPQNSSSSYSFFENHTNGQMTLNFVTIEGLFSGAIVKTFRQSDTVASSIYNQDDNNILYYKIPQQLSTAERINLAGTTKTTSFDFRTHQYLSNIITTTEHQFKTGGTGSYDSSVFKALYQSSANPSQSYIPVDTSQRAVTNIPDAAALKKAFAALLAQNATILTVPGDSQLTAGQMIYASIPNKISTTGFTPDEPLLSGNLLISRIHHYFGERFDDIRYRCFLECLKGEMNAGTS